MELMIRSMVLKGDTHDGEIDLLAGDVDFAAGAYPNGAAVDGPVVDEDRPSLISIGSHDRL